MAGHFVGVASVVVTLAADLGRAVALHAGHFLVTVFVSGMVCHFDRSDVAQLGRVPFAGRADMGIVAGHAADEAVEVVAGERQIGQLRIVGHDESLGVVARGAGRVVDIMLFVERHDVGVGDVAVSGIDPLLELALMTR